VDGGSTVKNGEVRDDPMWWDSAKERLGCRHRGAAHFFAMPPPRPECNTGGSPLPPKDVSDPFMSPPSGILQTERYSASLQMGPSPTAPSIGLRIAGQEWEIGAPCGCGA